MEALLKNDPICQKVEDFIKELHEKDIQLNPNARTFMISTTKGTNVWGKPIEVPCSLADKIASEMAQYQRTAYSETIAEALLAKSNAKDAPLEDLKNFTAYLNLRDSVHGKKSEIANTLFTLIEIAQANNLIDEIGLGSQIKALQEENLQLKERNASLHKLNTQLAEENTRLHRLFPDSKNQKGMTGDLLKP